MSEQSQSRRPSPGRGAIFVPNPNRTLTYRVLRRLVYLIMKAWFRPKLEGPGTIPESGPVIIAPVHRSYVDFGFAIFTSDRKMFFMAKDSLWKYKILGRFLLNMGAFPVHRESADRSALAHAEAVLREGQVLVMFPEGTRQDGPLLGDILEGAPFLSARTGASLAPLGIAGSAKAMPKGSKVPRPAKVHLYLGDVMTAPEKSDKGRVSRSAVHQLSQKLRDQLQDAFNKANA